MPKSHQLAQINVAHAKGSLEGPVMKEFVENIDRVNELAARSPGFAWRWSENPNDEPARIENNELIVINFSVWESIEDLKQFVFKGLHGEFFKRRTEWFERLDKMHMAMWWIERGHEPSFEEAREKLQLIQERGETADAFSFRRTFDPY